MGTRCSRSSLVMAGAAICVPAHAHVKWFAPYTVAAPPQPLSVTLGNVWFWTALALVLVLFVAARMIEAKPLGQEVLARIDKQTRPLRKRLDAFVRFVIACFFVAIFAVGGVYLTPELKTDNEYVSWVQLLIAALVFSRRTMPLAAVGIGLLWLMAAREYGVFHLLDYLPLCAAVAGYLVLEPLRSSQWRTHRFRVLRWGVAFALMWSSLEKFAYPQWFYPLLDDKPFLSFGLPREVFIPLTGVAEFTMAFGLMWTPLIKRLSAVVLFLIFSAAVVPFGRVELIGHALIMAVIIAVVLDRSSRDVDLSFRNSPWVIPGALAVVLLMFSSSYWSFHRALHLQGGQHARTSGGVPSLGVQVVHRGHGPGVPSAALTQAAPDVAFVLGMIEQHHKVVELAQIQLKHGSTADGKKLAQGVITSRQLEIADLRSWLARQGSAQP